MKIQPVDTTCRVQVYGRVLRDRASGDQGGKGMTKADLVVAIARASGGTKASAERALNACLGAIRDALKRGRRVTLGGFGTFAVAKRAARSGRNPRTGKLIKISAARVPRFKPSKALKMAVR